MQVIVGEKYQIESFLCSIADSASSNDRDLVRRRLRLGAVGEQVLAEVTLGHDDLYKGVHLTRKYGEHHV